MIDEDGVDRTPKPMLSLKPTVMHQGIPGLVRAVEESATPTSEVSEIFPDNIQSANFSRGMFSTSGTLSPGTSEEGDNQSGRDENSMVMQSAWKMHEYVRVATSRQKACRLNSRVSKIS